MDPEREKADDGALLQGDQRLPHDSGRSVDVDALNKLGVLYYHFPSVDGVDALAAERGYKNRDEIKVSPQHMGEVYEDKVKMFFHEHLHEDEEIRYIRDGQGYFDVRSKDDEWVRVQLEKDDLLILPAGIYHRFTTDDANVSRGVAVFLSTLAVLTCRNSSCMRCVSSRMSRSGLPSTVTLLSMRTNTARTMSRTSFHEGQECFPGCDNLTILPILPIHIFTLQFRNDGVFSYRLQVEE